MREDFRIAEDRITHLDRNAPAAAPAEVPEVLAQHPPVTEVAVFGLPDGRWGRS